MGIISRLTSDTNVTREYEDTIARSLGIHHERFIWVEVKTPESKRIDIRRQVQINHACETTLRWNERFCWMEQLILEEYQLKDFGRDRFHVLVVEPVSST